MSFQPPGARSRLYKKRAIDRTEEIFGGLSDIEAVSMLAYHLSTDCKLHQSIADHWMKPLFTASDTSVQAALTQRINTLLTLPIRIEITYSTIGGRNCGVLLLFGQEAAIFGIPFEFLRTSAIPFACIERFAAQGGIGSNTQPGVRRAFQYRCVTGIAKSIWSEFQWNHTFNQQFHRAPFVASILAYLSATAFRCNMLPTPVNSMQRDYLRTTRHIALAAMTASLSQLFGRSEADEGATRRFSWLDRACANELYLLREACDNDATFTAVHFDRLLLGQYQRICHLRAQREETNAQEPPESISVF